MTATESDTSFSAIVRRATAPDHRSAEGSGFLDALFSGSLPVSGYVRMLAQHRYAYDALESTGRALAQDPTVAPFLHPGLDRVAALDADLADLGGATWATDHPASEATERYVARLQEVVEWPAGFVAHHYTRYLGDLSGGQYIAKAAASAYGLTDEDGGRFATFDQIGDHATFKAAYRRALDEAPWDIAEQQRVIDEVRLAYRCNREVFADLARSIA